MATVFVVMCLAWGTALACAVFAVYQRRITWHCRGEQLITGSIVMQALSVAMQVPPFNTILGDGAHWLTGQWNLEAYVGYGLALGSMGVLAHHFHAMIEDDDDLRRGFRRHVELPTILGLALMFAFLQSGAGIHIDDSLFYLAQQDIWLRLYWLTFCLTSTWILAYVVRAIRVLRAYPSSRRVMTVYLCAAYCGVTAIAIRTIQAVCPLHASLGLVGSSVFGAGAMLLWTCGAAYSWTRRIRWFTNRKMIGATNDDG
jgi:hypothetical protein